MDTVNSISQTPVVETQTTNRSAWRAPLLYLLALAAAEALTTLALEPIGLVLHGILLVALTIHAALDTQPAQQRLLLTLTLAPLIRLLSLSLPLVNFPQVYWYLIVGGPLFLAAFVAARAAGYSMASLGLTARKLPVQLLVGATGLALGYLEYQILRPAALISALTLEQIWLPALILAVFTGLLEEVVFRGLMQRAARDSLGRWGVLYVAMMFAVLHFGYRSMQDVLFVLAVGLFFGWVVARTGSILGVTLAHSLTNISLFLLMPFWFNGPVAPAAQAAPTPAVMSVMPAPMAVELGLDRLDTLSLLAKPAARGLHDVNAS